MTANLGRWPTGEHRILDLLSRGALERVPGDPRYTRDLIDRAGVKLRSAKVLAGADPETAYIVAYDAARFLLTALLAAQGLRPKASPEGGHRTVQDAIDAQFPGRFRFFGRMRRLRNELEYPPLEATAPVQPADVTDRIGEIDTALPGIVKLTSQLSLFIR
ncbi:MAG TPA: hypothetical protein VIT42_16830 [Microlunatus sp.]